MKLPIKKVSIVLFCSAICFTLLRVLQLFFCIDSKTGFFKTGLSLRGTELSVIIFIFIIFTLLFSLTEKRVPKAFPKTSFSLAAGYILLALFLIADLIFFPKFFPSAVLQLILFYFSSFLTIILLLILGVSFFFEIPFIKDLTWNPMYTLIPIVFWLIRTVICFSSYTEMAILSENVFLIIGMLSILFILLYFAFMVNEVEPLKAARRMLPLFILALLSSINCSLPTVILYLTPYKERLHSFTINHITFSGIFIFLLILYFNFFDNKNLKERVRKHKKEINLFKH